MGWTVICECDFDITWRLFWVTYLGNHLMTPKVSVYLSSCGCRDCHKNIMYDHCQVLCELYVGKFDFP